MKKAILILLCAALCAGSICGCAVSDSGAYVATGDALEGATSATAATTADESDSAAQSISMCYYADAGFNPYTCTNFTNRALFSFLYQSLGVLIVLSCAFDRRDRHGSIIAVILCIVQNPLH